MSTAEELPVTAESVPETKEKGAGDATEVKAQKRAAEVNDEDVKKLKKDHSGKDKENGADKEVNDEDGEGDDDDDEDVPEGEDFDEEDGEEDEDGEDDGGEEDEEA